MYLNHPSLYIRVYFIIFRIWLKHLRQLYYYPFKYNIAVGNS